MREKDRDLYRGLQTYRLSNNWVGSVGSRLYKYKLKILYKFCIDATPPLSVPLEALL